MDYYNNPIFFHPQDSKIKSVGKFLKRNLGIPITFSVVIIAIIICTVYDVRSLTSSKDETMIMSGFTGIFMAHFVQMIRHSWKDRSRRVCIHLTSSALAIDHGVKMLNGDLHLGWHHMSYGLLCLIPGYYSLGIFGALLVFDEIDRYNELYLIHGNHAVGGLDDVVFDYLVPIAVILSTLTLTEMVIRVIKREKIKHLENQQRLSERLLFEDV